MVLVIYVYMWLNVLSAPYAEKFARGGKSGTIQAIAQVVRVHTGSGEQHVSCSLLLTITHDTQNTTPSVLSMPRALRIDTHCTCTLNSAHKEQ